MQRNGNGRSEALYSQEAEWSVLGGLMLDAERFDDLAGMLDENAFASDANRELFRAMRSIYDEGKALDPVTLTNRLRDWGVFDRIGGPQFISFLYDAVPTSANIGYHAEIVRSKAHLRRLNRIAAEISELATSGKPADEAQEEAERLIFEAGDGLQQVDVSLEHIREGIMEALARMESKERDVEVGFRLLDWHTQGFGKGDLVIVAARPSMGKTALAMQFAVNVARQRKGPVAVFSLEMTTEAICRRMMFTEACVDSTTFRQSTENIDELRRLTETVGMLNQLPLYITSHASTVAQVRGQVRRLAKKTGEPVRMVVIDYLGKMRGTGRTDNRVHEIGQITGGLKAMALEFECPVILLCQLSRAVESRPNKTPMLSDLRDSGEIEQDADTVLMLYRPEYYHGPTRDGKSVEGMAEIHITKQRNGKTGMVPMRFYPEYTRFEDIPK